MSGRPKFRIPRWSRPCRRCGGAGKELRVNGPAMRLMREAAGISQAGMARKLDISKSWLCDLELGRSEWPEPLAQRYLEVLRPKDRPQPTKRRQQQ